MLATHIRQRRLLGLAILLLGAGLTNVHAWDYEGHRLINQLALASLPDNFPAFVKTPEARERIAFLSGEADRWRNTADLPLRHFNAPDHFLDFEYLDDYELSAGSLSPFRYEFVSQMASVRALRPDDFEPVDSERDSDRTRALIGFLPWTITEYQSKLKSAFSYLKVFEELGTEEEIVNARKNIIYLMGVMGHFVGDGAQPLHTTRHYNGWTGDNPEGYTTSRRFHAWIDGGFIKQAGFEPDQLRARIRPARLVSTTAADKPGNGTFPAVVEFLHQQFEQVGPLYDLDKAGKLNVDREERAEGREFIGNQLLAGSQMLGDLWLTAWKQTHGDSYLQRRLEERQQEADKDTDAD
jgi:hypothetical protein